jgi:hypothetical protein
VGNAEQVRDLFLREPRATAKHAEIVV